MDTKSCQIRGKWEPLSLSHALSHAVSLATRVTGLSSSYCTSWSDFVSVMQHEFWNEIKSPPAKLETVIKARTWALISPVQWWISYSPSHVRKSNEKIVLLTSRNDKQGHQVSEHYDKGQHVQAFIRKTWISHTSLPNLASGVVVIDVTDNALQWAFCIA